MNKILEKINNLEGVNGKIALKNGKISLSEKSLNLAFLADFSVGEDLAERVATLLKREIPQSFSDANVVFEKIVAEKEFVFNAIKNFLRDEHKVIEGFISFDNAEFTKIEHRVKIKLFVSETAYDYINGNSILDEMKIYLENCFVDEFSIITEKTADDDSQFDDLTFKPNENDLYTREKRTFKVDEVTRLFDNDPEKTCTYISDTKNFIGEVYVAGTVNRIEERETKTGKPFFIIEINDRTGTLTGTVFPTKANLPKVQKIQPSSEIIARGDFQKRGDYINFTFRSINWCVFPKNFVPKERAHRTCPKEYSLVFPQKLEIESQDNFLEVKTIPECFKGRTFVVFDLETTGTDLDDKITEIGAVKMIDGVATEYFSTLVNPEKRIPQEVVNLTGISDDMVKDAPKFSEVCGDFYKFCQGSTLVAHNMDFDSRFIKRQGEAIDFYFDNPLMDTLALARENIFGVSNYKLNTLCDKFGIVFRHHRAYSDALATSELFVEIIRIRKSLPF